MAFYFVTGKLGNGKSLVSVARIHEKMKSGCRIATNIDLNLESMSSKYCRDLNVIRVPDKPCLADLTAIGKGTESYDESKNGLLVLDECGSWFNSRNWQDKQRAAVNDWFRHARKLGWDVILIVQDISLIDSQARDALSEHVAFCKRLDNMRVPIITPLFALIGIPLKFPKIHIARVVLGTSPADLMADRWVFRGTHLYSAYDTKQIFSPTNDFGSHSVLTPWHLNRLQLTKRNTDFFMRITKIYLKKLKAPLSIFAGILLGIGVSYGMTVKANDDFYLEYTKLQEGIKKFESLEIPEKVPDIPNERLKILDGLKIVGYSDISGSRSYDLKTSENSSVEGIETVFISSIDLSKSFDVQPVSPCHLRIGYGGKNQDVFCF
jgi:hypothetical protein